jgi:hypothetical protein
MPRAQPMNSWRSSFCRRGEQIGSHRSELLGFSIFIASFLRVSDRRQFSNRFLTRSSQHTPRLNRFRNNLQRWRGESWPWETVFMPKRSLRIVKHLGQVPCVAVCTFCGQQFKAPMSTLPRVKEAQASIQKQFDRHKCKPQDATQNAVPSVNE